VIWGLGVLGILSYGISKEKGSGSWKVIVEHLIICLVVIVLAHFIGNLLSTFFI
jgi:hypothetical protein